MKYQILAGTLGFVLLMGIVPIPAYAVTITIDDFSNDSIFSICDLLLTGPPPAADPTRAFGTDNIVDGTVLGEWRIC